MFSCRNAPSRRASDQVSNSTPSFRDAPLGADPESGDSPMRNRASEVEDNNTSMRAEVLARNSNYGVRVGSSNGMRSPMRNAPLKLQPFPAAGINAGPEGKAADTSLSRSLTLAAMSLGYGVVQLDVTIVNTALDSIGTSLGGGVAELQWVVSAYTIAFAAFILTAGALGDRIGAKRIFMAGFAIFTAASVACALAPDATVLILARSVQGLGAAILVPNSLALLGHAYPDEKQRGRAVGIWAAGASLALTAGSLVGGGLIALGGWRSLFLVNLPIGLAGLWLSWRYASETTWTPQRQIDLPGQAAAIATLGCLAAAIIEGGALGWSHPFVIVGFVAAAVLALLFVWRERRA